MGGVAELYEVLGLPPTADAAEVKRAFRKIARTCHPDVAGDDPEALARFKKAREAYEVLSDEARRAAYEAEHRPRPRRPRAKKGRGSGGSFFRAYYRRAGGGSEPSPDPSRRTTRTGGASRHTHGERFRARRASAADSPDGIDLDDLFADDFGYGQGTGGASAGRGPSPGSRPRRGDDVILEQDVAVSLAREGGTLTVRYVRLGRAPGWTPTDPSPGTVPTQHETRIEVAPGTKHASVRRYSGLGDAGAWGGPFGDLVVRFRLVEDRPSDTASQARRGGGPRIHRAWGPGGRESDPSGARATSEPSAGRQTVDITVFEALLGGRIEVSTPGGPVRMAIPPCTSSGTAFRLRGKGEGGSDLVVEARIVTPEALDDEGRALVERLARLHPEVPDR